MQAFINFGSFEKTYFQERTNFHPRKSLFGPPKILFRTPGWVTAALGLTRWFQCYLYDV